MIDFDRLITRFHQFGGWRLVAEYARMGVLWTGVKALANCVARGKSLKEAYPVMTQKVDDILISQYGHLLKSGNVQPRPAECEVPKIVWFSWLQGLYNAPDMVKACYESQRKNLADYEFRVMDMENFSQWVELPYYVVRKYNEGKIPSASFSDLLRLSLLKKYGGVWMDASVFCSGFGNEQLKERWNSVMHHNFTVFRYFWKGQKAPIGLSTWFIAAVPNNQIVTSVLDALLAYWKDYDCLVDYYIIHLFMSEVLRNNPGVMATMPRENSYNSLLLGNALGKDFSDSDWKNLTEHVSIHKLNYRKAEEAKKNPNGYYRHIIG